MFSLSHTRAKARALIGAALAGILLGVVVGGAYLAGIQAKAAEEHARIGPFADAAKAGYLAAARSPLPAPIALADNGQSAAAIATISAPPTAPRKVNPASPFHLAGMIEASRDIDCLSAAVYYEARGESAEGQAAVAQVVLNRARQPSFPKSVCGVVYQGCQFSFTCNGATRGAREPGAWLRARSVAARALGGYVMAQVGRATGFHAARLGGGGAIKVGGHVFFGSGARSPDEGRVFVAEAPPAAPKAEPIAVTSAPQSTVAAAVASPTSSTAS